MHDNTGKTEHCVKPVENTSNLAGRLKIFMGTIITLFIVCVLAGVAYGIYYGG